MGASLVAQDGREFVCNAGDPGLIPGLGDPLEKRMATLCSILAWRIPWTEEPGGLQSMGSQRVRHDWATNTYVTFSIMEICRGQEGRKNMGETASRREIILLTCKNSPGKTYFSFSWLKNWAPLLALTPWREMEKFCYCNLETWLVSLR